MPYIGQGLQAQIVMLNICLIWYQALILVVTLGVLCRARNTSTDCHAKFVLSLYQALMLMIALAVFCRARKPVDDSIPVRVAMR